MATGTDAAYFDDGTPLGSVGQRRMPDRLDQPVVGGAVGRRRTDGARSARWMRCARTSFAATREIILLLTPPFDRGSKDPGYIKGYIPGIRENGGQYTHAAVWTIMALARLGYGDEAFELFHMINPINHTRDRGRRSALRHASRTSSMATSTHIPNTRAEADGPGTRARPAGCTAWRLKASLASSGTGTSSR